MKHHLHPTKIKEVCRGIRVEPKFKKLTSEKFKPCTVNTLHEARLDAAARTFWAAGQITFFDMGFLLKHFQIS